MLDHALKYAGRGFAVFPLHTPTDGVCSCNNGGPCLSRSIGKHPRTQHGLNEATTDPEQIRRWWARWPEANIGWATGQPSGRWVLDVDGPVASAALAVLEADHGALPPTLTIRTGREGGEHRVFAMSQDVANSTSKLGPKIDVRGTGGYAILPPSMHELGRRYEVAVAIAPVPCPAWVFELLAKPKVPTPQPVSQQQPLPVQRGVIDTLLGASDPVLVGDAGDADAKRLDGIVRAACDRISKAPEGQRNETLNRECFSVGGWLDGLGGTVDQVAPALEAAAVTADQAPATVRRVLEAGRVASRGRPPDNNREDVTWHDGTGPAPTREAPTWIEVLREAVKAGMVTDILTNNAVLLGIQRPGVYAGEVEILLGELGHQNRLAIRRAGKELVKAERTAKKQKQVATLPLAVHHGKTMWVLEKDRYLSVNEKFTSVEVGRLHPLVDTTVDTENGSRYMSATEVFGAHGVTARRLCWTYEANGSTWDAEERVLTVPGARVRQGRADRSELVEGWLAALVTPERLPKLLDWLATAPRLDRPTSCAQLIGPGSVGKGMLAVALGVWLGGRMSYKDATGEFNGNLIYNPLVVLDEGVEDGNPDAFRSITGNTEHPVTEKGRMSETLIGCPRVLVISNETDPLQLGRRELSSNSEHALGRRILVFEVQTAAAEYLKFIGGMDTTAPWTGPDGELVCHLRWLAETRDVVAGDRFLVDGDGAAWVQSAHLRAGVAGNIVQAYIAYQDLEEDHQTAQVAGNQPFYYHPDRSEEIGVCVGGLLAHWKLLIGDDKRPTNIALSKALRRMSGQDVPSRVSVANGNSDGGRQVRVYWVNAVKLSETGK